MTGVPGLFLLCWPRLRMLHRLRLAWGCVPGTGSWGGRGAPRGIVEGPGLETSKQHRAIPSTPGRQHMVALVTQNRPSQRSPGSSPWRSGLCQSHPLIPQPSGLCRAPRECLYPGAPTPSPRRGQGGQDETWFPGGRTYRQVSLPALEPQLPPPPQAGKGVKQGANVPAPPVPLHTGLLLLQHKAGDRQCIEEDHAHDVGDGVPLVLQALLEPARSRCSVPDLRRLPGSSPRPPGHTNSQVTWSPRIPAPVKPQLSHCTGESG